MSVRLIVSAVVLSVSFAVAFVLAGAGHAAPPPRPAWLPPIWWQIGVCETQLNWRHRNGRYQGAFGFDRDAWDSFKLAGYPDDAYDAAPREQYAVALAIHRRYGFAGWGCYTRGGYRHWRAT